MLADMSYIVIYATVFRHNFQLRFESGKNRGTKILDNIKSKYDEREKYNIFVICIV